MTTDALFQDVKPIPALMPTLEPGNLAHYPDELNPLATYQPDPAELLRIQVYNTLGTPVRFLRVLNSFERVHLIFFVPRGRLARWERLQQDPIIAELKEAVKALQEATQNLRHREIQLVRTIERARRLPRPQPGRLPLDPIVPATTAAMPARYHQAMSAYYYHMLSWLDDFSFQDNQAWGRKMKPICQNAIAALESCKAHLTTQELGAFKHWLAYCATDPGMWYLKVNETESH